MLPLAVRQPICGRGFSLHIDGRLTYDGLVHNIDAQEQYLYAKRKRELLVDSSNWDVMLCC